MPNFKNNFFAFRRAYFTYENKISDKLKFRFRYDADNTANGPRSTSRQATKDDKLRPFIKHLYLEWSNFLPNSSLKVGMTETLTFKLGRGPLGLPERRQDPHGRLQGHHREGDRRDRADLGASLTGTLGKDFRYGVMVSNGAHYSHPEGDKYKKLMAQVR